MLDEIEIIPQTTKTEQLIRYALVSAQQGTGTAGDLTKFFTSQAFAVDLHTHIETIKHGNLKILMTLQEYNDTIRCIEYFRRMGNIDDELAETAIRHLRDAYHATLKKSGRFPTGFLLLGLLCTGLVGFFGWRSFTSNQTPSTSEKNNLSQTAMVLPLAECGKNVPSDQILYPVWANKADETTLIHIRQKYCSKAFVINVNPSKRVIQVAAFHEQDKAVSLARMLENDPKIENGEVGIATRTIRKSIN